MRLVNQRSSAFKEMTSPAHLKQISVQKEAAIPAKFKSSLLIPRYPVPAIVANRARQSRFATTKG